MHTGLIKKQEEQVSQADPVRLSRASLAIISPCAFCQKGAVQADQAYSGNCRSNQNESPLKTEGKAPSHALGISQDRQQ